MIFNLAENALQTRFLLEHLQERVGSKNVRYSEAYVLGVCKAYTDTMPGKQAYHRTLVRNHVCGLQMCSMSLKGFYNGYTDMMMAICYDVCMPLLRPTFKTAEERIVAYFINPDEDDFFIEGGMIDEDGVIRVFNSGLYDKLRERDKKCFTAKIESNIIPEYLC